MTTTTAAPVGERLVCSVRDADIGTDEAGFLDLVAQQAGLPVPADRRGARHRVAVVAGQVAGFASHTPAVEGSRLDFVYVHHHARRRGVGRALVADALGTTDGVLRIESHPCADTFFGRVGAVREGTLPPAADAPWSRAVFRLRR